MFENSKIESKCYYRRLKLINNVVIFTRTETNPHIKRQRHEKRSVVLIILCIATQIQTHFQLEINSLSFFMSNKCVTRITREENKQVLKLYLQKEFTLLRLISNKRFLLYILLEL